LSQGNRAGHRSKFSDDSHALFEQRQSQKTSLDGRNPQLLSINNHQQQPVSNLFADVGANHIADDIFEDSPTYEEFSHFKQSLLQTNVDIKVLARQRR
jgi:hypothetical protein